MKVSVLVITFMQEQYISQCLESIVNQTGVDDIEIMVHDDASTDKTTTIVKQFAEQYPQLIKPFFEQENQYSKGKSMICDLFKYSTGDYIAICEGDDYWCDTNKIQRQVEALDKNPRVNLCFNITECRDAESNKIQGLMGNFGNEPRIIPCEKVIEGGGEFMGTNSLMIRRSVMNKVVSFIEANQGMPVGDVIIQILGSEQGALYLPYVMSTYRVSAKNSWSSMRKNICWEKEILFKEKMQFLYYQLDDYLHFKFHKSFLARRQRDCVQVLCNDNIPYKEKKRFIRRFKILNCWKINLLYLFCRCTVIIHIAKKGKHFLKHTMDNFAIGGYL